MVKPDSPGYHYLLGFCQVSSRVVDPSAINGTLDPKPYEQKITLNYAECLSVT